MPIRHRYDESLATTFITLSGRVTDNELLDYARKALQAPPRRRPHRELIDARDVSIPEATTETLRKVANLFNQAETGVPGVKVAIVAVSDAEYGIARMYQAFRGRATTEIRVFRDIDEARSWLGLPPE